jgi:hypothetical protein
MLEYSGCKPFRCPNKVGVYLLPEVPVKPSYELVFLEQTKWSEWLGEEVKLHELQYKTKWSVLNGRGWGE